MDKGLKSLTTGDSTYDDADGDDNDDYYHYRIK